MTLQHQTFTSICGCVIEQLHEPDSGLDPVPIILHKVCDKHLTVVKDLPKLSQEEHKAKRDPIIKNYEKLLTDNRIRHLNDFDNHEDRKAKLETIKELAKSLDTEKHALKMDAVMQSERRFQEGFLARHEDEQMQRLLTGLYSPYAFFAKEVHDAILAEQPPISE